MRVSIHGLSIHKLHTVTLSGKDGYGKGLEVTIQKVSRTSR